MKNSKKQNIPTQNFVINKKKKGFTGISEFYIHSIYLTIICCLFSILIFRFSSLDPLKKQQDYNSLYCPLPTNSSPISFVKHDVSSSFYELSPYMLPHPTLKLWKWKSGLSDLECRNFIEAAEDINDWGEYSAFGKETPTFDVSVQKLPYSVSKPIEGVLRRLATFIADTFMLKNRLDGLEMKSKKDGLCPTCIYINVYSYFIL